MKNTIKASILLLILLSIHTLSFSQLAVNTGMTAAQLVQNVLIGGGINAYNITSSAGGTTACIGQFSNGNTTNLGITAGVVMSCGLITNIPQAASNTQSDNIGLSGDASLTTLAGNDTYDAGIIEFDFVPLSNIISFRYVFGSEEYPEYVGSVYNDVFGFFISGPNPLGGNYTNVNLALIPSTTTAVAINNVNNGSANAGPCTNCAYYINNSGGTTIVYDGLTHVMTATCNVTPCVPYHIKLAVADAGDHILDSGVFLEAGSFSGNNAFTTTIDLSNPTLSTNAIEDCSDATVSFTLNNPTNIDTVIHFTVAGTATNGVDYSLIPTSITIPAGATTGSLIIHPLPDALVEGNESVKLIIQTPPCGTDSISVNIQDNPPFSVVTTPNTSVCDNDAITLTSTVTGGLIPYTYQWNNTVTTPTNTVYPTGIGTTQQYILTVTDACLANVSDTTSIVVNNCTPCATYAGLDNKICGLTYGLLATTQPGDHNMVWTSISPGVIFGNASSPTSTVTVPSYGTYKFIWTVTNVTNLTCSDTVSIIFAPIPTSTFTAPNPNCLGNNVVVTYTGSAATSATFTWDYGGGTGTTTGAGPHNVLYGSQGNYTISLLIDDNGCISNSTTQSINVPPLLDYSVTTGSVSCNSGTNGTVITNATGGTTPYIYTFSNCNCATAPTVAGSYHTTVTDFKGCTDTTSFVISQPNPISVSQFPVNLACNADGQGSASVTVQGGTPGYTYSWSNNLLLNSPSQSNMQAGTYIVSITDANGCQINQPITLTEPPALVATQASLTDVSCFGGTNGAYTVTATGGTFPLAFNLTGLPQATGSFTGLNAGNYAVTVTDDNTCSVTLQFSISEPSQVTVNTPVVTNIPCFGQHNGVITVTGSGGTPSLGYSIGGTAQTSGTFTGLYPGTYVVTVTDSHGCTASSVSAIVSQPVLLTLSPVTQTNLNCNNVCIGTLSTTASGGTSPYLYAYPGASHNIGLFQNLCAGAYSLTVTDAHGCTVTANQVTITEPQPLIIVSQNATSITCNGNTATLTVIASGGTIPLSYNYSGTPATGGNFTGLHGGSYTVTITDNNGCTINSNTFNIIEPPLLHIIDSAYLDVTCYGAADGKIHVSAIGGTPSLQYSIQPGIQQSSNTFTGLDIGTYMLTVKDSKGCTDATTFTLTQPDLLVATATSNAICYGDTNGTAQVVYSGGTSPYHVLWSNAETTDNLINLGMGVYFVQIKDSHNCVISDTVTITQPLKIHVTSSNDTVICKNDQTMLSAHATGGTQPYTYLWNGNAGISQFTAHLSKDSIIYVSAFDINGCKGDTARIDVNIFPDVKLKVYADDTTVCVGSPVNMSFQATGGSGNAYLLYDENGVVDFPYILQPNYTKTYYFKAFDNVCPTPGVDSITIYAIPLPNATFLPEPNKGCEPLTVNFSLVTDVSCNGFFWNFGEENAISYSHSPQHVYNTSGIFDVSVTVTSDSGCVNTTMKPQIIEVFPKPDSRFDYTPAVVSIVEPEINFTNFSTGAFLNIWSFGDGDTSWTNNPVHVYQQIGEYNVQLAVESDHGCKDTSKAVIRVKDEITVYVPTAFSPDNDGINDIFYVMANGLDKSTFNLKIYDRWGELIYESNNIEEGWNGSVKKSGKGTSDTYVWMFSFKDLTGKRYLRTGNVTLIR